MIKNRAQSQNVITLRKNGKPFFPCRYIIQSGEQNVNRIFQKIKGREDIFIVYIVVYMMIHPIHKLIQEILCMVMNPNAGNKHFVGIEQGDHLTHSFIPKLAVFYGFTDSFQCPKNKIVCFMLAILCAHIVDNTVVMSSGIII